MAASYSGHRSIGIATAGRGASRLRSAYHRSVSVGDCERAAKRAVWLAAVVVVAACGGSDGVLGEDGAVSGDATPVDGGGAPSDAGAPRDGGRSGTDAGPLLGPPYPIVLAHGFFGFDDFAGAGFLDYFYGVRARLEEEGETLVFTPAVDPFNSSAVRGAELSDRIDEILASTGHAKVVIVGHSQGGLDARVVAHDHPERVAAVVTIATPHGGSPVADTALDLAAGERTRAFLDALVRLVGAPLYDEVGDETSVFAALEQFSTDGVAAFDAAYPDAPGVAYRSIAGVSALAWGPECSRAAAPPFISRWSRDRDPIDPLLSLTSGLIGGTLLDPHPNDGLVRVEDAEHGAFLGCVPADHLDEVGQLLGDGPGLGNDFDYLDFYVELVRYLRDAGL